MFVRRHRACSLVRHNRHRFHCCFSRRPNTSEDKPCRNKLRLCNHRPARIRARGRTEHSYLLRNRHRFHSRFSPHRCTWARNTSHSSKYHSCNLTRCCIRDHRRTEHNRLRRNPRRFRPHSRPCRHKRRGHIVSGYKRGSCNPRRHCIRRTLRCHRILCRHSMHTRYPMSKVYFLACQHCTHRPCNRSCRRACPMRRVRS